MAPSWRSKYIRQTFFEAKPAPCSIAHKLDHLRKGHFHWIVRLNRFDCAVNELSVLPNILSQIMKMPA